MQKTAYAVQAIADGAWVIEMEIVRSFIIAGETSALLIDTGAGGVNLRAAVRECTGLPVRVVNTHAHFDHISGDGAFEMIFAHPKEILALDKAGFRAHPVGDGAGFDLGGRILQVVGLPGHSPGSIALWDGAAGLLFAGDTIAVGRPVTLCFDGASLEAFVRSMDTVLSLVNNEHGGTLRRIFCAHGELETTPETAERLKICALGAISGEIPKEPVPESERRRSLSDAVRVSRYQGVSLLVN